MSVTDEELVAKSLATNKEVHIPSGCTFYKSTKNLQDVTGTFLTKSL